MSSSDVADPKAPIDLERVKYLDCQIAQRCETVKRLREELAAEEQLLRQFSNERWQTNRSAIRVMKP